ncbi:ubiquitin conjugating enzyme family protein [Pisolithus orientalis]|uniref:ubiquitin conjugating enzyme family protein n=1 Tax=Pisolithus orientalis TaxID=936130 RepID=UPI0022259660|nr:ubiquitin conjugating enzyme family protein [Pisolithus orientalis]KAI6035335.1 ubiquitin conjugating enzyme family protein [Pisolithus orientalis]
MDKQIQQLVEMGATVPQACAALHKYKDVMQAAERIFDGEFAHVHDEGEGVRMQPDTSSILTPSRTPHASTPEDVVQDHDMMDDDIEDDVEDYVDYESDFEIQPMAREVDPYAGIFFSKDRREDVIEVEEEAEFVSLPESKEPIKLMTQGEWMKGCPEGNEQSFLFALYDYLCSGSCPCPQRCGFKVPRKKYDFFSLFPEFPSYIEHLQAIIKQSCPTCKIEFCFACGEMVNSANNHPSASSGNASLFHCSNMQGVILGVGLAMLEATFAEQRQQPIGNGNQGPQRSKSNKKRKLHAHSTPTGDDEESDSYYTPFPMGRKAKGGTGYAGDQREDTSGQLEAQAQQRVKDEKIGFMLSQIRVYLPSLRRHGGALTSDYMVHPTALAHLRRRFNYLCSTLLRNDSLTDMSERSVLYFKLFEWLETISNHEALASMMAMPIMVISSVKSVAPKKAVHSKAIIRERAIIYEGSAGPRELLEAIVIQARAAIKGLEGMKSSDPEQEMTEEQKRMTAKGKGKAKESSPPPNDENEKLLAFCNRILATASAIDRSLRETKGDAFVDRLHASLPKILTSSTFDHISVRTGETEEERKKGYLDWAMQVRFEYCDLTVASPATDPNPSVPHYKFYFNNEARMIANSDFPKRSLAIAKELAVLTTNLPVSWDSSVFLKVDENRVDIIKALIIGPEGTPYQDGCFLFDIFLGPTYNHTPPSVKYMTTNGGRYRFNPNLYADGKVCLSLLGTWSGPGWISGRSTLLQVLVSIQSMILCDEPYLNEPGWANAGGTPQSKAYSANVRRMVVKTAMLGNLKTPPEPFSDVIRTHYRLKADVIITQLDRWLALDDGRQTTGDSAQTSGRCDATSSSNGFKKDVEEMQSLLRQLKDGTFQY